MVDHEEAKRLREKDFFDPRNVRDEFKGLSTDAIKHRLSQRSNSLHIVCSNEIKDFNWGSVVRSANSFNVGSVTFVGRKSYDRRGAVGAQNYMDIIHYEGTLEEYIWYLHHYVPVSLVAAEYDPDYKMIALPDFKWQTNTCLFFGEEGRSLPKSVLDLMDDVVYVPMYGSVRSLNLASCATTFMYDYDVKMRR